MEDLNLSEEEQQALNKSLEDGTPPSRELFYRWMKAVEGYRKQEDSVLEIGIVGRNYDF